ncbi:MAG: hypothetical protein K0R78_2933 [Pelosinus sp.]|jgi:hypothetical protein|nr:hypothetical protein [Pelosinus sp.]
MLEEIERVLDKSATIKSPEYVMDRDTGTRREVDISIRRKVDQGEIFIAIECRDRGHVQDIIWVEQLIMKKQSVGADVLIAVTSTSFTEPARIKANKHGIILRNVEMISGDDIELLANSTYVELHSITGELKSINLAIDNAHTLGDYLTALEYCRYYIGETGECLNFDQFVQSFFNQNLLIQCNEKLTKNGESKDVGMNLSIKECYIELPHKKFVVVRPRREQVLKVNLVVGCKKHITKYPLALLCNYRECTDNDLLAEMYEYRGISKVIVNDTNQGCWKIDLSKAQVEGIIAAVVLKCKEPIALNSYEIKM